MLYADDLVFVMTHPVRSLQALKVIVDSYGLVSGYKINEAKSTILGINVEEATKENIQRFDVTPWKRKIKYLGINVSLPLMNVTLVQSNLDPWMRDLVQQLENGVAKNCHGLEESLLIKMKILPILLFLFQALVFWLMKNDLWQIQKKTENFLWEGRKPRFKNSVLKLPKNQGGLAFPNIEKYYHAALIEYNGFIHVMVPGIWNQ